MLSQLVGNAGRTMGDVVAQVRRVNDMLSEIRTPTNEQTIGIGQVNDAVTQLDEATQQNAALGEESRRSRELEAAGGAVAEFGVQSAAPGAACLRGIKRLWQCGSDIVSSWTTRRLRNVRIAANGRHPLVAGGCP